MNGKLIVKITVAAVLAVVFTTGCAMVNYKEEIPELREPAAINYAYRPVEYGTIGDTIALFGTVVPQSHCFFYKTGTKLSEIVVQVGDSVGPGDVLAYADIQYAIEQRDALIGNLDYENANYELSCQIADEEINKLNIYRKEALDAGDGDSVARCDVSIATMNENGRYDEMLHQARVKNIEEEIAKQQEIIDSGTLTADCSGSVTYIKNIAYGSYVSADENVIIVSDPEDKYIELETTLDMYRYSNYEVKYLQIGTDRYEAKEIDCTPQELVMAKVRSSYPNVRISCPEGITLNIGDTYPVYYRENDVNNVLVVGRDSIHTDDGGDFVYVKSQTQAREKRYVEKGREDSNYAEILDGVTEGELIFYESSAVMPSNYIEYTIKLSDYEISNFSQNYELADTVELVQRSEYEGEIMEICVQKNQEVAKGDLLYVIDSGEGKAALTKARFAIEHEKTNYGKDVEYYDKELERLRKEDYSTVSCDINITEYRRQQSVMSHERNLASLQARYDELHKGNDGTGKISVYSEFDGVIGNISVRTNDKVAAGYDIMTIAVSSNPKMYVKMSSNDHAFGSAADEAGHYDNIADIGERITFEFPNEKYMGECIGWTSDFGKIYLFTDDDGVQLTYSAIGADAAGFYVAMDDDSGYAMALNGTVKFLYVSMTDVVVVPSDMVKQDSDGRNYVWRIKDGELIKQYVLVDDKIADRQKRVVLSGLNPGDVLASSY